MRHAPGPSQTIDRWESAPFGEHRNKQIFISESNYAHRVKISKAYTFFRSSSAVLRTTFEVSVLTSKLEKYVRTMMRCEIKCLLDFNDTFEGELLKICLDYHIVMNGLHIEWKTVFIDQGSRSRSGHRGNAEP